MIKKKEVQIVVKCSEELRMIFVDSCKKQDSNASREIRKFMRDYIKINGQNELEL